MVSLYQKYGSYLSVLLGKHGDIRFVNRMKGIIYPVASAFVSSTSESSVIAELKVEFILSAVLATITKWYDMDQPIPTQQLGMMIRSILQQGLFL